MTLHKILANEWSMPSMSEEARIRRYSTTGDILSFKRCRRQYGMFGVRGFVSATNTQRYFGTLVHDVLDHVTRKWKSDQILLTSESDVAELIEQAHERLIRSGVRPYGVSRQKETAGKLTYRFLQVVGSSLIPNVQEAEYRLERSLLTQSGRPYILEGIVDVLAGPVSHRLGIGSFSTEDDDIEIWDYKSGRRPAKNSSVMRDYEYQMRVYAELYRNQRGEYPARCILAFLGELGKDPWDPNDLDVVNWPKLLYVVDANPKHIAKAVNDFHDTVDAIEQERERPYSQQWLAPDADTVEHDTCAACELRFRCDGFKTGQGQRKEPL